MSGRRSSFGTSTTTVSEAINDSAYDNVKIVADNIEDVNTVGSAIDAGTFDIVSANVADVNTVADSIVNVNTVSSDIVNVNTVAIEIADINTTATDIDKIKTVAANILDINNFADTWLGSYTTLTEPTMATHPALTIGDMYFNTDRNRLMVYGTTGWGDALTLTEASINTLTNKTINDTSNNVHANAVHYAIKASGSLVRGDILVAVNTTGNGTIIAAKQSSLSQPAIGISDGTYANNELGKALTVGVYKNYDSTGLTVGQILYPNGTGGFTNTPTIAPTNYNQPSAYVAEINGGNAQLIINFHSAHESADLVSYNGTTSGLSANSTQDAIDEIIASKGSVNGIATLDNTGLIPANQLPSYVDDVIEVPTYADLPIGTTGFIYIVVSDETQGGDTSTYRWTGSVYALVSNTLTASDVKNLYESNANTNVYTDAEKTKVGHITVTQAVDLDTIETNSNTSKAVTDKTNVSAITSVTFNADGTITIVTP